MDYRKDILKLQKAGCSCQENRCLVFLKRGGYEGGKFRGWMILHFLEEYIGHKKLLSNLKANDSALVLMTRPKSSKVIRHPIKDSCRRKLSSAYHLKTFLFAFRRKKFGILDVILIRFPIHRTINSISTTVKLQTFFIYSYMHI